jgi:hypothetical protein
MCGGSLRQTPNLVTQRFPPQAFLRNGQNLAALLSLLQLFGPAKPVLTARGLRYHGLQSGLNLRNQLAFLGRTSGFSTHVSRGQFVAETVIANSASSAESR